jgi:hypothetical protein
MDPDFLGSVVLIKDDSPPYNASELTSRYVVRGCSAFSFEQEKKERTGTRDRQS